MTRSALAQPACAIKPVNFSFLHCAWQSYVVILGKWVRWLAGGQVKGVESIQDVNNPTQVARDLAYKYSTVVAITGQRDILSDGRRTLGVDNGDIMLKTITGSGCMATSAVAAFCAVESDALIASAAALACYGLAAQAATKRARGALFAPSFSTVFINFLLSKSNLGVRIVEME